MDNEVIKENGNEGGKHFPFQIQTQIVKDSKKCPIQKKLEKLKVTNFESYEAALESIKNQISSNSKKVSANSKLKTKQLKDKLDFLESNEKYIAELAKTFLDYRTYNFIEKKNLDFLYYVNSLSHLKKFRGLIKTTSVYFYPNLLETYLNGTQSNGRQIQITTKMKSSSGKLIISQLRFLFVDIDGAPSWEAVNSQIKSFGLTPDVVIQTSEKSFHLYWSIHHIDLDTKTENKSGNQLDRNLILYELSLKSLISEFSADKARSNASSLMRVPNTWNIKLHKNKKFKTKYLTSEKTLEQALRHPTYNFNSFIDHISKTINPSIYDQTDASFKLHSKSLPELDEVLAPSQEKIQNHIELTKKKVEFDFTSGWDSAFLSLCNYFKINQKYFNDNDIIVLKQMWTYRLCSILNFPEPVRLSLKGSGNKYSELKVSIDKIANLPRKLNQYKNPLIFLVESYKKPTANQIGKRNGYKVSTMFLEACGQNERSEKTNWLKRISENLYTKGQRNNSIPYDCFVLSKILEKSISEARQFLTDKVERSANQTDVNKRCSNDISNVDNWLRYYYV